MRVDTRFHFSKVPLTGQHSKHPGSLLLVERVWGLTRQPECVVSRDTGYLLEIVLA